MGITEQQFSGDIIRAAWTRQDGLCAKCGTHLVPENLDKGEFGAWHPHPKIRELRYDLIDNCVILCINPPNNCHIKIGHNAFEAPHFAKKCTTVAKANFCWD